MKLKQYLTETTNNEGYGFFGSLRSNYQLKNSEANKVFDHFEKKFIKMREFKGHINTARDFLDSKWGRHFADAIYQEIEGDKDEPSVKVIIKSAEKVFKKWGLKGMGFKKWFEKYDSSL